MRAPSAGVFRAPDALLRYLAVKGSVAVDGVSLTVNEVGHDTFSVALIPHTIAATTFRARAPGDGVNLEVDVVARYVERLRSHDAASSYGRQVAADEPLPTGTLPRMAFSTIPELLEEIRAGRMVVIVDDEDRENEGDLIMAADWCGRPTSTSWSPRRAGWSACR